VVRLKGLSHAEIGIGFAFAVALQKKLPLQSCAAAQLHG